MAIIPNREISNRGEERLTLEIYINDFEFRFKNIGWECWEFSAVWENRLYDRKRILRWWDITWNNIPHRSSQLGKTKVSDKIIYFIRMVLSSKCALCTFWASQITLWTVCAHSCKERKEIAVFQLKFGNFHFIFGFKCVS